MTDMTDMTEAQRIEAALDLMSAFHDTNLSNTARIKLRTQQLLEQVFIGPNGKLSHPRYHPDGEQGAVGIVRRYLSENYNFDASAAPMA